MDQSVISGVGNIFRAETLLRCGVSPFRAGSRLSEDRVRRLWHDLVPLMEYGVATEMMFEEFGPAISSLRPDYWFQPAWTMFLCPIYNLKTVF